MNEIGNEKNENLSNFIKHYPLKIRKYQPIQSFNRVIQISQAKKQNQNEYSDIIQQHIFKKFVTQKFNSQGLSYSRNLEQQKESNILFKNSLCSAINSLKVKLPNTKILNNKILINQNKNINRPQTTFCNESLQNQYSNSYKLET